MTNSSLIGHTARWAALARAFDKGTIPQTLLISGAPHVGKWTLARRFAQLLLCPQACENRDEDGLPSPCGTCRVCHQVEIETFPDFKVFRPIVSSAEHEKDEVTAPEALEGSLITVDMARRFDNETMRRPLSGQRKVMMILGADRMNEQAQNALLKTFEEPARSLSIVLLCDNPHALLPTVLSRCWHLPLGLAGDEAIAAWLREQFPDASGAQLDEAARVAAGRPGAAWREVRRLTRTEAPEADEDDDAPLVSGSRFAQTRTLIERIERSSAVGALGLTEEALRLSKAWWAEDADEPVGGKKSDAKKSDAKATRSSIARFLDELSLAYRARWLEDIRLATSQLPAPSPYAPGLDLIRKTRHYVLRNAGANLALDALFLRLIALHRGN